jgi:hypothetical protein
VHIGSNEIRRALARTAVGSSSPSSVGSADSGLHDDLLGSMIDPDAAGRVGRGGEDDRGGRSRLRLSTVGSDSRAIPRWLKDIHGDILAAAFLLERARRTGKHAAQADSAKYARGLSALATLTERIKDSASSSAAAAAMGSRASRGSAGGTDRARSTEATSVLQRAASMVVKAATTLLMHAFGGAVRPLLKQHEGPAKASGPARARRSPPAGGVALPGLTSALPAAPGGSDVGSAGSACAPEPTLHFRSTGACDDGFVSAVLKLLMALFHHAELARAVSDRSLNALFVECMLRVVDEASKPTYLEDLSRLVMRVLHRARHDMVLCALVDVLARAQSPDEFLAATRKAQAAASAEGEAGAAPLSLAGAATMDGLGSPPAAADSM